MLDDFRFRENECAYHLNKILKERNLENNFIGCSLYLPV